MIPVAGDWPILREFFDRLLLSDEPADEKGKPVTIDQRPHFFAWLLENRFPAERAVA